MLIWDTHRDKKLTFVTIMVTKGPIYDTHECCIDLSSKLAKINIPISISFHPNIIFIPSHPFPSNLRLAERIFDHGEVGNALLASEFLINVKGETETVSHRRHSKIEEEQQLQQPIRLYGHACAYSSRMATWYSVGSRKDSGVEKRASLNGRSIHWPDISNIPH